MSTYIFSGHCIQPVCQRSFPQIKVSPEIPLNVIEIRRGRNDRTQINQVQSAHIIYEGLGFSEGTCRSWLQLPTIPAQLPSQGQIVFAVSIINFNHLLTR